MIYDYCNVSDLFGLTLIRCELNDEAIEFEVDDGRVFRMYHSQDCCEHVYIESINGDLSDLVGSPLTLAEETDSPIPTRDPDDYIPESETWTFYRFGTIKGFVDIRWYGSSNGYYSESVSFALVKKVEELK